jgi:hypothetical protein
MATVLRVAMKLEVCFILKERGREGELRWRQKQVISLSAAAAAFSLLLSGRRRGQQKKFAPPSLQRKCTNKRGRLAWADMIASV